MFGFHGRVDASHGSRIRAKRWLLFLTSFSTLQLMACAHLEVTPHYAPEIRPSNPVSLVVDKPFDRAWDEFIRRISQGFFDIQQVSKESRLISLTVDERRVPDFVTCGRVDYEVNGERWAFDPARDADFVRTSFGRETVVAHRTSGYVGRINIFVAPEGSKTVFEVNGTFELVMSQSGHAYVKNLIGDVTDAEHWGDLEAHFRLTTARADEQDLGRVRIRCQSSGVWEDEILRLAR